MRIGQICYCTMQRGPSYPDILSCNDLDTDGRDAVLPSFHYLAHQLRGLFKTCFVRFLYLGYLHESRTTCDQYTFNVGQWRELGCSRQ